MSSTNRGAERSKNDYYRTPSWCVDQLISRVIFPDLPVIDAGCGDGAIGLGLTNAGWEQQIFGLDIDDKMVTEASMTGAYEDLAVGSYLDGCCPWHGCNVIMNPPYNHAQEFIEASLGIAGRKGNVAALLRLNFLGSQKRLAFWKKNPSDVYVLSKRPSFTGGPTDSCDYAWFVWPAWRYQRKKPGTIQHLEVNYAV